jgi:hypothetical protein
MVDIFDRSILVVAPIKANKAKTNAVIPNIKIIELISNITNIIEKVNPETNEYIINITEAVKIIHLMSSR